MSAGTNTYYDPRAVAYALGGEAFGNRVSAPGPGHGPKDRSMSILIDPAAPGGLLVNSFAGDDPIDCKDHVRKRLRLPAWNPGNGTGSPLTVPARPRVAAALDQPSNTWCQNTQAAAGRRRVLAIWDGAVDPRGTVVEVYLRSRALHLPDDVAGSVLRFYPCCPWEGGTVPAMVALFRDIQTGEITGVHRTALTTDGQKIGRKMLGRVAGAAIKLDANDDVTLGLHIGEGVETCLAARQLDLRPTWALGSVRAIRSFPVLYGIEALTVLAETGDGGASEAAAREVGFRWYRAGRTVDIIEPRVVGDLNDALRTEVPRCR